MRPGGHACLCALDVWRRSGKTGEVIEFVLLVAKGLIRSQHTRRQIMFYTLIAAMLMLFAGGTFLQGWLRENLVILVAWWFVCGFLTIFAALLALFDILLLRIAARHARREMEQEMLREARRQREREQSGG